MKTDDPSARWLGDAGPWLARTSYYLVAGKVYYCKSATQEGFVWGYAEWCEKVRAQVGSNNLSLPYARFRGAPDFYINPWTLEEHQALWKESVLPPNPWGR